MNKLYRLLVVAGIAVILSLAVANTLAQDGGTGGGGRGAFGSGRGGIGGGNFDLTQIQQQLQQSRLNNYRTQLEVTNDKEWETVKERLQRVLDARQAPGLNTNQAAAFNLNDVSGLVSGMLNRGTGGGNAGAGSGGNAGRTTGGVARRNTSTMGAAARRSPEEEALQKALDAKASSADLKAAQTKITEARKASKVKMEKAQEELRKVLSPRQEAIAVLLGLL
jgi:hypothetical protein